jgi:hypothetical protein
VLRLDEEASHARRARRAALARRLRAIADGVAGQREGGPGAAADRRGFTLAVAGSIRPASHGRGWRAPACMPTLRCGFEVHALRRSDDDAGASSTRTAHDRAGPDRRAGQRRRALAADWPPGMADRDLARPSSACSRRPRSMARHHAFRSPVRAMRCRCAAGGSVLFGATSQAGDDDPTLRESDHRPTWRSSNACWATRSRRTPRRCPAASHGASAPRIGCR